MSDTAAPDAPATSAPPSVRRCAHILNVKAHLALTDGTLGFALLGAPVASVTAMVALGLLPLLTAFIVVGTSLTRALKTPPQHHGRPASAGSTR